MPNYKYNISSLKLLKNDRPNGINTTILQAVQHYSTKGTGTTFSFNFLHLTMQEFWPHGTFLITVMNDR